MAIEVSTAQRDLFVLIRQVNDDRVPVMIGSPAGDVVLMASADYNALQETAYLLTSPVNAQRLLASLDQARPAKT